MDGEQADSDVLSNQHVEVRCPARCCYACCHCARTVGCACLGPVWWYGGCLSGYMCVVGYGPADLVYVRTGLGRQPASPVPSAPS